MNLRLSSAVLAVMVVWLAAMAGLLAAARLPAGSTGRASVWYPPDWSRDRIVGATLEAGASPMRDTWLPGLTQVWLDDPSSVRRLAERGALLVLPPVPFEGLGMGGCSWLPNAADAVPAHISKLRAGPL